MLNYRLGIYDPSFNSLCKTDGFPEPFVEELQSSRQDVGTCRLDQLCCRLQRCQAHYGSIWNIYETIQKIPYQRKSIEI